LNESGSSIVLIEVIPVFPVLWASMETHFCRTSSATDVFGCLRGGGRTARSNLSGEHRPVRTLRITDPANVT
jgi:hypothetical protein